MDCFDMKIKARRIMVIMMVSKTIDAGSIPAEPVMLRKKNYGCRFFFLNIQMYHNLFLLPFCQLT